MLTQIIIELLVYLNFEGEFDLNNKKSNLLNWNYCNSKKIKVMHSKK